jgi:uncharacterized delta-60 repeat protein
MKKIFITCIICFLSIVTLAQRVLNDPTFNVEDVSWHPAGYVLAVLRQPDGKIIVGAGDRINRYNSDGSTDNIFWANIGNSFANVKAIALQSDGKIIAGGDFTNSTYNNGRIIRLNSNGTIDNTFNVGTGFDASVQTIAIQPDGKIIVGGRFTSYGNVLCRRIVRLNSNGSLDNTFNIGSGFNDLVNTLTLQSDGKIIVGGLFSSYNGNPCNYIARLNSDVSPRPSTSCGVVLKGFILPLKNAYGKLATTPARTNAK